MNSLQHRMFICLDRLIFRVNFEYILVHPEQNGGHMFSVTPRDYLTIL